MMRMTFLLCVLLSVLVMPAVSAAASAAPAFSDVKGHWAERDIQTAVAKGFVSGYPNGTFRPNGTITRAEAAGMLSRVTKLAPESNSAAFADLDKHWSRDQVRKLVALGFIDPKDYKNGFEPDKAVTRYEVMKWIASGLAKSNPDFAQALSDTKETLLPTPESFKGGIAPDQVPYIALVRGTGIIEGFEDGTMRPANTTTRAEVTAIMLRYEKVEGTDPKQYRALNELREVGLTGTNLTSLTPYQYWPVNKEGTINDYNAVRNKTISMSRTKGTIKVHRMIVVDPVGESGEGVYAKLFVEPSTKKAIQNKVYKNSYLIYVEQTVASGKENMDYLEFSNSTGNFLLPTGNFENDFLEQQGFHSYPVRNPPKDFFAKGKEQHVWLRGVIKKNKSEEYGIRTDDNTAMFIRLEL